MVIQSMILLISPTLPQSQVMGPSPRVASVRDSGRAPHAALPVQMPKKVVLQPVEPQMSKRGPKSGISGPLPPTNNHGQLVDKKNNKTDEPLERWVDYSPEGNKRGVIPLNIHRCFMYTGRFTGVSISPIRPNLFMRRHIFTPQWPDVSWSLNHNELLGVVRDR